MVAVRSCFQGERRRGGEIGVPSEVDAVSNQDAIALQASVSRLSWLAVVTK